jgi:hypothetical protein
MMPNHDIRMFLLAGCALMLLVVWAFRISRTWAPKYESVDSDDDTCCSDGEADLDEILISEADAKCTVTICNDGGGHYQTSLTKNQEGRWGASWV